MPSDGVRPDPSRRRASHARPALPAAGPDHLGRLVPVPDLPRPVRLRRAAPDPGQLPRPARPGRAGGDRPRPGSASDLRPGQGPPRRGPPAPRLAATAAPTVPDFVVHRCDLVATEAGDATPEQVRSQVFDQLDAPIEGSVRFAAFDALPDLDNPVHQAVLAWHSCTRLPCRFSLTPASRRRTSSPESSRWPRAPTPG